MRGHDPEDVGLSGHARIESAQIPALANRKSPKAKPGNTTPVLQALGYRTNIHHMPISPQSSLGE
jgi:hypothetical protein